MRIEQVIGRQVRTWREFKGLTQSELGQAVAEFTGSPWSRQAVSAAEAGNRGFSASDLMALALTLQVQFGLLLCPTDLDESEVIDLPSGQTVPARTLVDLYYGGNGEALRGSAPLLKELIKSRFAASTLLEDLDGTIGVITQEMHEPAGGWPGHEQGGEATRDEGADQEDQAG